MRALLLHLFLVSAANITAQDSVTVVVAGAAPVKVKLEASYPTDVSIEGRSQIAQLELQFKPALAEAVTAFVSTNQVGFASALEDKLTIPSRQDIADFRGKVIELKRNGVTWGSLNLISSTPQGQVESTTSNSGERCVPPPITSMLAQIAPLLRATPYGLQMPSGSRHTRFGGQKYVHLFFDHRGQNIFSTIPQGISNYQYVVHIIYLTDRKKPGVSYAVQQTQGEFTDGLLFVGMDTPNPKPYKEESNGLPCAHDWAWEMSEFLLSTSTRDIEFKIVKSIDGMDAQGRPDAVSQILGTYNLKMAKVYHGSIDIGFINSTLSNPTFTLVPSVSGDTTVVKRAESGDRGFVTLMATFYTSPVLLFRNKDKVPAFKRTGRNFLDDHAWYERIYPCVGVSLSDKAFENLFLGLNWEFARGGSLWLGYHYGRVNVYNAPDDFEFGVTPVSQNEFDLRTDTQWIWSDLSSPSFGVNLDLRLVTRLFSSGGQTVP